MTPTRREVLGTVAALGFASRLTAADAPAPVIDSHTHFYDPTRPQGVPWPGKSDNVLYRTVMPAEFRKLAEPLGVTGTVVVEASPWVEDNQWLLDLAGREPFIVGVVGRLLPADADFAKHLARFAKAPKFRGVRINHSEVADALKTPAQLDRLRAVGDAGLTLDVLGGPDLLPDAARLAEKLSKLPVVIDHLANPPVDGTDPPKAWRDGLAAAAARPNVWCKLSGLVEGTRKPDAPADPAVYRPVLDAAWAAFGPGRLVFGGNWPVSVRNAPYRTVFEVAAGYAKGKGADAFSDVFGRNAVKAYGLGRL